MHVRLTFLGAVAIISAPTVYAAPIASGTIFLDPDIIVSSDRSTFGGVLYAGTGSRVMFDRRVNAFVTYSAFLFTATYSDGRPVEIQVNPEFGTSVAAEVEARKYGFTIGQLPAALRTELDTIWVHQGTEPFGGGNRNLLIHTGQSDVYAAAGILEETLVHEASHTSLDPTHAASPGWLAAQSADADFISTYARDFPGREDIAETFLPWLAVRHRRDRISATLAQQIESTVPNRLAYFDNQSFDVSPVGSVPEPATGMMLAGALLLLVSHGTLHGRIGRSASVMRRVRRKPRTGTLLPVAGQMQDEMKNE